MSFRLANLLVCGAQKTGKILSPAIMVSDKFHEPAFDQLPPVHPKNCCNGEISFNDHRIFCESHVSDRSKFVEVDIPVTRFFESTLRFTECLILHFQFDLVDTKLMKDLCRGTVSRFRGTFLMLCKVYLCGLPQVLPVQMVLVFCRYNLLWRGPLSGNISKARDPRGEVP